MTPVLWSILERDTFYDGVDSNCDGLSDFDMDGDGYDSDQYGGTDCEDQDPNINPPGIRCQQ